MSSQVFVSKSALLRNLRAYRRAVGGTRIMSIVKSQAYGHGLMTTAKAVESLTDWLGVASGSEALELRLAGIRKPILILSFYNDDEIADILKKRISLVVYDLRQAKLTSQIAKKLKLQARVHLKVDTGTSRLGVLPVHAAKLADQIIHLPNIDVEGLFSHFAASEENIEYTKKQNMVFDTIVEELEWRGIDALKHISCTAAGITTPQSRHDMVRLGIGLYGLWPSKHTRRVANFALKPALMWHTNIIQVKSLPKGSNVGYGLSFVTKRPTKLAILPVGYFDGYDRKLSNIGEVLVAGSRCKVLGRVCMNLTMIDVTHLKNAKAGDKAVLIGRMGREEITADELAEKIGTINYEVVSRINPLIPRKLV